MSYLRPESLDQALEIRKRERVQVLAGGTDIYPAIAAANAWGGANRRPVMDISGLKALRGIARQKGLWRIGALTTWSDITRAQNLPGAFDGLKAAAREIGGLQIQNRATVAGNLINASPAADGVPPLLALEAEIEIASMSGVRNVALSQFIDDYRHTQLGAHELVTAIIVPELPENAVSHFLKLGARRYLVISIVIASAVIVPGDDGVIADARIAVGACSPVAQRLPGLETALERARLGPEIADLAQPAHFEALSPIGDVRASAAYRRHAAQKLVADMLAQMAGQEGRRTGDA